ncbi:hypothetical protein PZA11_000042 [Diplocarpon coronariae]
MSYRRRAGERPFGRPNYREESEDENSVMGGTATEAPKAPIVPPGRAQTRAVSRSRAPAIRMGTPVPGQKGKILGLFGREAQAQTRGGAEDANRPQEVRPDELRNRIGAKRVLLRRESAMTGGRVASARNEESYVKRKMARRERSRHRYRQLPSSGGTPADVSGVLTCDRHARRVDHATGVCRPTSRVCHKEVDHMKHSLEDRVIAMRLGVAAATMMTMMTMTTMTMSGTRITTTIRLTTMLIIHDNRH